MELPLCQKYWISPLKQRCPILVRLFEQRDSVYVQKDPETVMTLLLNCLHIVYSSLLLPASHGEQKGVTCGCFACLPWFVGLFIFFCVVVVLLFFFYCCLSFCCFGLFQYDFVILVCLAVPELAEETANQDGDCHLHRCVLGWVALAEGKVKVPFN